MCMLPVNFLLLCCVYFIVLSHYCVVYWLVLLSVLIINLHAVAYNESYSSFSVLSAIPFSLSSVTTGLLPSASAVPMSAVFGVLPASVSLGCGSK